MKTRSKTQASQGREKDNDITPMKKISVDKVPSDTASNSTPSPNISNKQKIQLPDQYFEAPNNKPTISPSVSVYNIPTSSDCLATALCDAVCFARNLLLYLSLF